MTLVQVDSRWKCHFDFTDIVGRCGLVSDSDQSLWSVLGTAGQSWRWPSSLRAGTDWVQALISASGLVPNSIDSSGGRRAALMPFLGGLWRWGGGGEKEGKLVFSLYQWRWGDHTAGNGADHQEVTVLVMGTSSGVEPADRADVFWIWDFLNFAVNDSFRWEFWSEFRVAIVTVQMNEFLLFRYFSSWSFQS